MIIKLLTALLFFALAILAARGSRWAYAGLVIFILLQFPASDGFHLHPKRCDLDVSLPLTRADLRNYPHMILFGIFSAVTTLHFRLSSWRSLAAAIVATVALGAGMELAQGLSGTHHCKAIDLLPDFIGAVIGVLIVVVVRTVVEGRESSATS